MTEPGSSDRKDSTPVVEPASTIEIGGDLRVHRLGFGAMRITGPGTWGPPADRDAAIRVLRRAMDLGVDFIDTADSYGPFVSEELIAEALYPYPEGLVIATKAGYERPGPGKWTIDSRPERLRRRCESSLLRLRLERIDLFQLHRIDPTVPLVDQIGALLDLQAEGKIRHIGVSEVSTEQLARALELAPVVSVQNRYNILDRRAENVLGACEEKGLVFIPWAPLDAGPRALDAAIPPDIPAAVGASATQVALAWLLHRSPRILPIPGTRDPRHLEENMDAARIRLTPEQLRRLDDEVRRRQPSLPRRIARGLARKLRAVLD